jgi:ribosome-associated protein
MDGQRVRAWLETRADISFSRSSGPGGQNVNKTSTRATIFAPVRQIDGLSAGEKNRLLDTLRRKLTIDHVLIVSVQETRSQLQNRIRAVDRAYELLERGLHRDAPRKASRPTRASRERRLQSKRAVSRIKQGRARPGED